MQLERCSVPEGCRRGRYPRRFELRLLRADPMCPHRPLLRAGSACPQRLDIVSFPSFVVEKLRDVDDDGADEASEVVSSIAGAFCCKQYIADD